MNIRKLILLGSVFSILSTPAFAGNPDLEALEARIKRLEQVNQQLLDLLGAKDQASTPAAEPVITLDNPTPMAMAATTDPGRLVGTNAKVSFDMLDHTINTNTRQLVLLKARAAGELPDKVTLGGTVTALADYQKSSEDSKFGWLMRHPTPSNQIGKSASEAVVHSANLSVTANVTEDITAYLELLYDPEQSFGAGTITALGRNQLQARKAYVMWGNLDKSPVYASLGKMDIPFGLNDTVSPFTNSTNWHAFAGLAYGAQLGYYANGLHVRGMAVQGGSQFRSASAPVRGTNVPSKLNNFAVDANYAFNLAEDNFVMVGGSYQHGTSYCHNYPVVHFNPCDDNNPAFAAYAKANLGAFTLLGEFAETTKEWAGTAVPDPTNPLSVFEASKATSFTVGGKYDFEQSIMGRGKDTVSLEYSKFISGANDAPWERQEQIVVGYAKFLTPSVKAFTEYVRVNGYVPLNFLSGGNFPDGSTWSVNDASTDIVAVGVQAGF